jgi:pimeloyl-ACP methyl ester carboxylesterase
VGDRYGATRHRGETRWAARPALLGAAARDTLSSGRRRDALRALLRLILYVVGAAVAAVTLLLIAFALMAAVRETKDRVGAAPTRGQFVRAADVDIYLQEWGPPDGTPVVFVHAAGGWSEAWKQTGEALAPKGFRSIALDMPPLGYSERPDTPRYSREAQARRVIGVLDAFHISAAFLVGHSFGSRAVAQAALTHPERVRGLVLVDPALPFEAPGASQATLLDAALRISPLRTALAASTFGNPLFMRKLIQLFVADPARVTPYWVALYQKPSDVKGTSRAIGDWLPQLVAEHDASTSSDPAAYAHLRRPVLLIWGEKDTTTPIALAEFLTRRIPGSQLITMPGVGHMPPIEDADAFHRILLEFLAAH